MRAAARALTFSGVLLTSTPALLASPQRAATATATPDRVQIEAYAACMAQRHYRQVSDALDRAFDAAFSAKIAALPKSGCDGVGASAQTSDLRGPLFAAMYRRYGPKAGRSASNILAETGWLPRLSADDPRAGWYAVSNCLAMHFPDASRNVVLAKSDLVNGQSAMQNVVADLPRCLPANKQYRIDRLMLADLLAETVYNIDFATQYGDPKHVGSF